MQVVYLEFLHGQQISDQIYIGQMRAHGAKGERVQLQCRVNGRQPSALHAALAQDALRQLRRMPENRGRSIDVAPHAMPRQRANRIIRLSG